MVNGVTEVIDGPVLGEKVRVAWGGDVGVQHFHNVDGLTSYATYCYGVQAYAFQDAGFPRVIKSPVARVCAEPRQTERVDQRLLTASRDTLVAQAIVGESPQSIRAAVVDPGAVTGLSYEVSFSSGDCAPQPAVSCPRYSLARSDGEVLIPDDPSVAPAYGESIFLFDGFDWSIVVPTPAIHRSTPRTL